MTLQPLSRFSVLDLTRVRSGPTCVRQLADWGARVILNAGGVPCGPVYRMNEVFADPQVRALEMSRAVNHPRLGPLQLVAQPYTMSRSKSELRTAAPDAGEHTAEILQELGYSAEAITELRRKQAI
jgi:formyl-CoA transferase